MVRIRLNEDRVDVVGRVPGHPIVILVAITLENYGTIVQTMLSDGSEKSYDNRRQPAPLVEIGASNHSPTAANNTVTLR